MSGEITVAPSEWMGCLWITRQMEKMRSGLWAQLSFEFGAFAFEVVSCAVFEFVVEEGGPEDALFVELAFDEGEAASLEEVFFGEGEFFVDGVSVAVVFVGFGAEDGDVDVGGECGVALLGLAFVLGGGDEMFDLLHKGWGCAQKAEDGACDEGGVFFVVEFFGEVDGVVEPEGGLDGVGVVGKVAGLVEDVEAGVDVAQVVVCAWWGAVEGVDHLEGECELVLCVDDADACGEVVPALVEGLVVWCFEAEDVHGWGFR